MYRIYDKAAAIREIQVYLREIADSDIFIAPSGIYDDNTRRAIIDFQSEKGLEITGEVDKATFDLLFSEHLIKKEKNEVIVRSGFWRLSNEGKIINSCDGLKNLDIEVKVAAVTRG